MSEITVAPYEFDMEVQEFRSYILSHENAQRVRWWRAVVDPAFNRTTGKAQPASGGVKWLHEEHDVSRYLAVVTDAHTARKYYPQGSFMVGDLVMMSMPDEIDLGDHDWICPQGRNPGEARLLRAKEPLLRGERKTAGVGTVSSASNILSGVGTAFTSFLRHGDIVEALGELLRVESIVSDGVLILERPPSPAWSGNTFTRHRDLLTFWPAARIEEIRDVSRLYVPADDFVLDGDRTIQWVGNSPAPGATLSIVYRYYPLYQVIPDMILGSHGVGRLQQPTVATLRLFKPDRLQE